MRIFYLESPDKRFPNVLIWADTEVLARKHAYPTKAASLTSQSNNTQYIVGDEDFYKQDIVSCKELVLEKDYQILYRDQIQFKGKGYSMEKNCPQIIPTKD